MNKHHIVEDLDAYNYQGSHHFVFTAWPHPTVSGHEPLVRWGNGAVLRTHHTWKIMNASVASAVTSVFRNHSYSETKTPGKLGVF